MDDYLFDIFPNTNFIHEQFDKFFTNNLILENKNHTYSSLYKFFNFLKKSVIYECGFLKRREFNTIINEQNLIDKVGGYIQKGVSTVKKGIQKGVEIGKKLVGKVTPYIKKFLDSEFSRWVPGVAPLRAGYDAYKIYQYWDTIKKMTFEDWVESFRSFLNGKTGIVLQIVLALTGVGNIANWIANGFILIYDVVYQGISKGNWNWYNIITSAIALVGTGAASAIFKSVKPILSSVKSANQIGPAIAKNPQLFAKISPLITKMGSGIGNIMQWVMKAFNVFTTKFKPLGRFLTPLKNGLGKIQTYLDEVVAGFKSHMGGKVGQYSPTKGNIQKAVKSHSHFDTKHISQKLLATGDKTLTKKVVGAVTKVYYNVMKGDTLEKIISKFKPQGVNLDILKQLNASTGLKVVPGSKIRVA